MLPPIRLLTLLLLWLTLMPPSASAQANKAGRAVASKVIEQRLKKKVGKQAAETISCQSLKKGLKHTGNAVADQQGKQALRTALNVTITRQGKRDARAYARHNISQQLSRHNLPAPQALTTAQNNLNHHLPAPALQTWQRLTHGDDHLAQQLADDLASHPMLAKTLSKDPTLLEPYYANRQSTLRTDLTLLRYQRGGTDHYASFLSKYTHNHQRLEASPTKIALVDDAPGHTLIVDQQTGQAMGTLTVRDGRYVVEANDADALLLQNMTPMANADYTIHCAHYDFRYSTDRYHRPVRKTYVTNGTPLDSSCLPARNTVRANQIKQAQVAASPGAPGKKRPINSSDYEAGHDMPHECGGPDYVNNMTAQLQKNVNHHASWRKDEDLLRQEMEQGEQSILEFEYIYDDNSLVPTTIIRTHRCNGQTLMDHQTFEN